MSVKTVLAVTSKIRQDFNKQTMAAVQAARVLFVSESQSTGWEFLPLSPEMPFLE